MIIQEVYIGRIPEIEDIFNEFKELRSTYRVWKSGNTARRTAKIEKMIEDFWGFGSFCLSIDPSSEPNAFTFPVATSLDIDPTDYIQTTSKGYRFNKTANVAAISKITKGLFCNKAFTDEEAFAVFLHEIGHSFVHRSPYVAAQQDVYKSVLITQILMKIIMGILALNPLDIADATQAALTSTNFYKKFVADFNKAVKKVPILRDLSNLGGASIGLIKSIVGNTLYTILTGTGISALSSLYTKWEYNSYVKKQHELTGHQNAYSRSAERLSDDFATMYGFGTYISSALVKMSDPDNQGTFMKVSHSIPVLKNIFNKSDALAQEVNGLLGAHPSNADRMLNILSSMESDLSSDKSIPDKAKKELRNNIKQQKKLIQDIKNQTSKIKNKNEYIEALTILGLINGDSEDFIEKKFTDRKALKKFYDERKIRKESAFSEQAEIDMILLGLEDYMA